MISPAPGGDSTDGPGTMWQLPWVPLRTHRTWWRGTDATTGAQRGRHVWQPPPAGRRAAGSPGGSLAGASAARLPGLVSWGSNQGRPRQAPADGPVLPRSRPHEGSPLGNSPQLVQ